MDVGAGVLRLVPMTELAWDDAGVVGPTLEILTDELLPKESPP